MLGDTIAALASGAGEAGVSLIRLSGPEALTVADRVFVRTGGGGLAADGPRRVCHGWLLEKPGGERLDEGLAWYMPGPQSYTGEDVVEISCHGGALASRLALQAVLRGGARLAEPGEFTRRAFLNGRVDLAQAEATIDLVRARTRGAFDAARRRLGGELSRRLAELGRRLLELLAEVEVRADFPEVELDELEPSRVLGDLAACEAELERLLAGAESGRLLREGLKVILVGRPNVGKSSLLNALLGEERAIVSHTPGTTRDAIEESLEVEGVPVVLVDTAGVREGGDALEMAGVARTRAALRRGDLALLVLDAAAGWDEEDVAAAREAQGLPLLVVVNKAELSGWRPGEADLAQVSTVRGVVRVSALLGEGLTELRHAIAAAAGLRRGEQALVGTVRQRDALERAVAAVLRASAAVSQGVSLDLVAVDLREARGAIGEVMGEGAPEAVLDEIFSRFCIGK